MSVSPPMLLAVVDTEEEFDWGAPLNRESVAVTAMDHVGRGQALFEAFGVRPVYVIGYPVAAREEGYAPLLEPVRTGRALLGAHLHPWNTPPFAPGESAGSGFPGALPREMEAAKLARLAQRIAQSFGAPPRIYKAGRYGLGPHTHAILHELGFEVDLSPSPPFDFRPEGGPDFSRHGNQPTWSGPGAGLLTLPTTGGYAGPLSQAAAHALFGFSRRPLPMRLRLPGLLSRLGLLTRLRLSPEGNSLTEMKQLTRTLLKAGVGIFSLSFHSPSLHPGHTPYVRDRRDLEEFLARIQGYLTFFFSELGGIAPTPPEIRERLKNGGGG